MDAIIGTAGWSISREAAPAFPDSGTSLERYASRFLGVEINSSFHRPHRPSTWEKWAASVPANFRFAVKVPKTITHQARLIDCDDLVASFAEEIGPLGDKLAVLLVQLPPSLGFDPGVANAFFTGLKRAVAAGIACEPRHPAWFEPEAGTLLEQLRVARVAADPALGPAAAAPGGWTGLAYWRLHGSPHMYRSSYGEDALDRVAREMRAAMAARSRAWCMFDNTAVSAATGNALSLLARMQAA